MSVHVAGAAAVGVGGDVYAPITTNIYGADGPPFVVESLPGPAPHELADLVALREQPSKLLNTRRRVIPFAGRRRELESLARWRDEEPRRAAWLLHAPGGQGKTRLAVRAAEDAATAGWTVGWARHRADTSLGGAPLSVADGLGLLIVVDYAERWPPSDLQALLARCAAGAVAGGVGRHRCCLR
ncbi:hypothetical protein ACIA5D_22430 [Actinoplanes sp. NPDC051513]|uniref:hypothetical protein n=1 Tax=Actinoplanes sp. NPDC051513 TaxID=3363908 RepID=UPI0037A00143